ncbi:MULTISPECIES: PTS transporter subunit IIC [unclassified Granulicatella]|uniref:PTS transporter subunit IIC n=1 Tax=unclassified Granulicatella TaxID=2630493 RepID=UPI0010730FE1|nr:MULTISPECIES: PTS sugar transporter subunit IIC [unclassified Granulicatella]MBF0780796.1 PTS sugar transporter subunit IIC [Granulicatella sp. 19428wC4_WM01]TFU93812.1 PTS sugar transporter subunit IIC [Granulicatella sp. WM01]
MKKFVMNTLNGSAMGVVIALIPMALLGELVKALSQIYSPLTSVMQLLSMTSSLLGLAIGVSVAYFFKANAIESASVGIATMLAGGAIQIAENNTFLLKGTGDIITMSVTAGLAMGCLLVIRPYVKGYAILMTSPISVVIAGGIGRLLLPYFVYITKTIGNGISHLLTLEQTLMCILLSIIFAYLIVSPISSVGIGIAISVTGVGSGAANLGICAAMFALAIAGRRVNSRGICLVHVIGSPKISMANIIAHPILFLPIAINATVLGILASIFAIQGTPMSAGFGLSGLVGPLTHLSITGWSFINTLFTVTIFVVVPCVLACLNDYVFVNKLKWIKPEYYRIELS